MGIIICGTISVIAATYFPSNDVTYDNTESGLTSTNVQGAIDELYGVCFPPLPAGEQIIEDAGLEKDPYECRYFFTGGNPNNYVTFNNEDAGWRIVSVECDGTIKIMRNESIGDMAWDTSTSNNWARPASLNTYLNVTYYNGLNATAKSQIVSKDWSIGAVIEDNNDLGDQVNDENSKKWNGKIALPPASEYIRVNSNKSNCGTFSLVSSNCALTNWSSVDFWWTLTANAYGFSAYLTYDGHFEKDTVSYDGPAALPSLYLSSEVTLSGSGTQSDPYTIN